MNILPITLREANDFVEQFHRHNGRTSNDGGRFAIAASVEEGIVGVAIVGRPLARLLQDGLTAEVLRVCTRDGSPKGTCSFLYSRCWRIWQAMGGRRLITYTLASEKGHSLKGAGWKIMGETSPTSVGWGRDGRARDWQPIYGQQKFRWEAPAKSEV
jgi:hypothetical protein